ncbi:laccase [Collybia nuda]|uniref:laccase n=1 Tax=Collybia nuda TaxID=64659 RepID=A0A9P6CGE7_9AGAR|nr:laccase [Collybia nuda]
MFSLVVLAFSLFNAIVAVTIGPVADLEISNALVSPDGFERSATLAGGTFPGPVIVGNKGDKFALNIINSLTDSSMYLDTSIHWHGIYQAGSSWADGASFITQCPIAANNSFLYEFRSPHQAGTFWYHSHFSVQYCDGLRGAFIIYDPNDPHKALYDVDDESTIITLSDWYHVPARDLANKTPPASQATLVNGKGRYIGGPAVPLAVINVQQTKRYRFRIIAMSCGPNFIFSIDQHKLLVIEADGENTAPLSVDSIQIYAGQRYSAVLSADQEVGNYWVRANPNDIKGLPGFDNGRNSAVLRYVGASLTEPTTPLQPSANPLKEENLHPLSNLLPLGQPWDGGVDIALNIKHEFDLKTFRFTMNGATFFPPTVPVLLQILSGASTAQELLPSGSVFELPPNKVIELSLPGSDVGIGGPHPFHLHGHSFSVVKSAGSTTTNYLNPVRRDTVNTGFAGDNATIRFVTDNAGPWFLHCHIDWHLELGLAVVFAENIPQIPHQNPVPQSWKDLCPKYD